MQLSKLPIAAILHYYFSNNDQIPISPNMAEPLQKYFKQYCSDGNVVNIHLLYKYNITRLFLFNIAAIFKDYSDSSSIFFAVWVWEVEFSPEYLSF